MPVKTCPRCDVEGEVQEVFGLRNRANGSQTAQSHCKQCRSSKNRLVPLTPCDICGGKSFLDGSYTCKCGRNRGFRALNREFVDKAEMQKARHVYKIAYPNDKANDKRSFNFMMERLAKRQLRKGPLLIGAVRMEGYRIQE